MKRLSMAGALAAILLLAAAVPLTGAAPLPSATPESVGMSSERLAKLGVAFQAAIAAREFPGVVIMVARDGKLIYSRALGELRPGGGAMPAGAIFRIYSMTKPLVSVAAMLLVEDGAIQLADPVGTYLPGFDQMEVSVPTENWRGPGYRSVPASRAMTVQDLLRHTSGLTYAEITTNQPVKDGYAAAGMFDESVPFDSRAASPEAQVAGIAEAPLAYHPGTVWHYGISTDILGRVVEVASGQRLDDFMQQRLFGPLGMTDTGFWVPGDRLARLAEPFETDERTGKPILLIDVSARPGNDSGGAGGVSTVGDYLRFCQMLLNGGTLNGIRVMSRTTVRWMTSNHLGPEIELPFQPSELLLGTKGYTFGLGFAVRREDGLAGVPGSAGDFTWGGYAGTFFWVDPTERLTAVLMTQAPGPRRTHYRKLTRQLVYQAIVD